MGIKFGYTVNMSVESRHNDGAAVYYQVGVGPIDNFRSDGMKAEYLSTRAILSFSSYAYADHDRYRVWGINPYVLPRFFWDNVPAAAMFDWGLRKQWCGACEPEIKLSSMGLYGGSLETMKFLCKVFEQGRSESLSKMVYAMSREDADRWYSWDNLTRTLYYLHRCGARAYKRSEQNEWYPMIETCQWSYDNARLWVDSTYLALAEMQQTKQLALVA